LKQKMFLIVSIDTEEDMPNWRPQKTTTTNNILCLPRLQKLFRKYSIAPTYLVNQPVLENDASVNVIRQLAQDEKCEIGAHLHSWNTPPLSEEEEQGQATYLSNQSLARKKEKLKNFTKVFQQKLGFLPTSYRAGRYGFCSQSAMILSELGYTIDSSIAPLMDFGADNGPNFRGHTLQPFWLKTQCHRKLLELPVTIDLVHRFPTQFPELYFQIPDWTKIKGVFHRLNFARLLWLRPTTYTVQEMKQLADHVLTRLQIPVINIMFHSSEICPGASPYNTTEQDVKEFFVRLETIFSYLMPQKKLHSVTLSEFASLCAQDEGLDIFGKKLLYREL